MAKGLNPRRKCRVENYIKCVSCGKMVSENYAKNGVTFEVVGVCQDCRSDQYGCAVNLVWQYEKEHNITGLIEVEGLEEEGEQVTPEGEDENGIENPEIEIAHEATPQLIRIEETDEIKPGDTLYYKPLYIREENARKVTVFKATKTFLIIRFEGIGGLPHDVKYRRDGSEMSDKNAKYLRRKNLYRTMEA